MLKAKCRDAIGALAAQPEQLNRAWSAVRVAGGGPGIDGQTVDGFARDREQLLRTIRDRLQSNVYRFSRLRRAAIPKADGQQRLLGIPTVSDRVVLQAIRQVIEPECEPDMLDCSHAYRRGRGAMTAIAQVTQGIAAGRCIVLETDIRKFFDSIRHRDLLEDLASMSPRTRGSKLLAAALSLSSRRWRSKKGVPQGSPLSPLLANVALTRFDRKMQSKSWSMVRYADDLVILCPSQEAAEVAKTAVESALADLGLMPHPDKTSIVDSRQTAFRFLGFEFHPDRIGPDAENLGKFRDSVLAICNPHTAATWRSRIDQLNSIIRSFAWYYHQADSRRLFWTLDQFVVDQLEQLESELGTPQKPWGDQIIKMARMRKVSWLGKSKRQIKGWNGYGS